MKRYIATLLLLAICASTQAREVFPLNEGWRFFFKSENSSDNARHVTLPHTWDTDTGGTGYFLETTANYQNDMYIPAEWATKRLFVKFYGVQSVADVFVNGYYVGGHKVRLLRSKSPTRYGSVPTMRCWSSSATITATTCFPPRRT